MKISELIAKLEKEKEEHGDIEVRYDFDGIDDNNFDVAHVNGVDQLFPNEGNPVEYIRIG